MGSQTIKLGTIRKNPPERADFSLSFCARNLLKWGLARRGICGIIEMQLVHAARSRPRRAYRCAKIKLERAACARPHPSSALRPMPPFPSRPSVCHREGTGARLFRIHSPNNAHSPRNQRGWLTTGTQTLRTWCPAERVGTLAADAPTRPGRVQTNRSLAKRL